MTSKADSPPPACILCGLQLSQVEAVVRNSTVSASTEKLVKMQVGKAHQQGLIQESGVGSHNPAFLTSISYYFDRVEMVFRLGKRQITGMAGPHHKQMLCDTVGWRFL